MYAHFRPTLDGTYTLTKANKAHLAKLFRDVLDVERIALAMEAFLSGSIPMPDGTRVPLPLDTWPKHQRYGPTPRTFATYYDMIVTAIEAAASKWAKATGEAMPYSYRVTLEEKDMAALRYSRRAFLKAGRANRGSTSVVRNHNAPGSRRMRF